MPLEFVCFSLSCARAIRSTRHASQTVTANGGLIGIVRAFDALLLRTGYTREYGLAFVELCANPTRWDV
jgi:hypothetical protein